MIKSIRLPQSLKSHIGGIDFAIWRFYVDYGLAIDYDAFNELLEQEPLTHGVKMTLSDKSINYLRLMVEEFKLSQSEVIRRCLFWLSKQATYPKNFQE